MSGRSKPRERELLRVELPYTATVPRLLNPDLGLRNVIARTGPESSYDLVVTLLDAPDHRLLRSGLMLAHRVLRERGEWLLQLPSWTDGPAEVVVPMSADGDLPPAIADRVAPFRRLGTLGAVAALTAERREYLLRDGEGQTLARIRDEKVTIRRSGLTTARFHEVTVTGDPRRLGPAQRDWLAEAMVGAGGTRLDAFPTVPQRLGAPATGPGDFPDPDAVDTTTVAGFVRGRLARWVRLLIAADLRDTATGDATVVGDRPLAVTGPDSGPGADADPSSEPATADPAPVVAARLRRELVALAPLLDPDWLAGVDDDLEWVARRPTGSDPDRRDEDPRAWRRGGRYLSLLELLISAVRTPRVGEVVFDETRPVLDQLLERALDDLGATASRLRADGPDADWQAVRDRVDEVATLREVCATSLRGRLRRRARRAAGWAAALDGTIDDDRETLRERAETDPARAFELGREYERRSRRVRSARRRFVRDLGDRQEQLR